MLYLFMLYLTNKYKCWKPILTHEKKIPLKKSLNIPKTFGYSHYSPGAIPNNLDAEWVLDNSDPVKPIALFSLRSCRNRQLHWYLIAIIIWVIDLHVEELLLHQFMHINHESNIAPLREQNKKIGTHLELQHVTAVIFNVNTECVNITGLWTATAPVLCVPNDINCHPLITFP